MIEDCKSSHGKIAANNTFEIATFRYRIHYQFTILLVSTSEVKMTYTTAKTTFLLNWYANPYHTPLFVAKEKGWLLEEGVDIAILETTNPSDVTEVVGSGAVDMGFKAMIHVLAAKDRGIDMKSFGTLLDEPPTGLIFKKSTKIESIQDLVGKKIGYIGHFGKIMVSSHYILAIISFRSPLNPLF